MGMQETFSVTEIKRLCAASEYLDGDDIREGDKVVSFDGNIVYYKQKKPLASGNEILIPVQIKGKNYDVLPCDSVLKYPISTRDLSNYFKNGGVIFFVVAICAEDNTVKTYAKILLPIDIKAIMVGKEKQRTIHVQFSHVADVHNLESLCDLFAVNRAKQGLVITGAPCPDFMSVREFSFSTADKRYSDPAIAIAKSSIKYIYAKQNGIEIPVDLHHIVTSRDGNMLFSVGETDFFFPVKHVYTPDKTVLTIYDVLQITWHEHSQKTTYTLLRTRDTAFHKVYSIVKFLLALLDTCEDVFLNRNHIEIDLNLLRVKLSETFILGLRQIIAMGDRMKSIGLPLEMFTTQEVTESAEIISVLKHALIDNAPVTLNSDNDCGVYSQKIGSNFMLLEYRRTDEGDFSLCDFLRNGTMAIVDCENNVPTQISKWFAILPERITDTVFCRDEMINDLRASNNKLDMGYLTFFVLALITDYDHNHNKESLTFASALLEIIEEKEPDDESSIINRLQIAYRLGSLTAEQKQELLSLKTTGSKQAICCACLLLEQYDEFRVHFNGLAASEKAVFTEWPIYNLFPSE